ncbi:MAG TPA: LacI family transcriptional regulator [Lachnospiraceae bacterium]|nr:LacI family transcriptional regulator [Lachnospiraceae bacterium]
MTIYDISNKAGVSIATVSRVLNGSNKVRPDTRKKVMDIIEQYDYTPNVFARGMGLHSLKTIGILCADSSDLFLAKAVYYIEQELQSNGYESLLCCTGYNLDIKKNYLSLIVSKKVDAIVLVGSNFIGTTEEENQYIKDVSAQVPIMLLNASFSHPNVYSIYCDDYRSMFEAATSMLDAGIRDILYLYNADSYSGKKKLKGFQDAMQARGITDYEKFIQFYEGSLEQINDIASFTSQIAKDITFHGIITSEDALAIGCIKYAQKAGICIPDDLSVIGYNNSMLTTCCTPELSSVDNCLKSQAHQLVQTLLGVLDGEAMPAKSIFSGKLVKRGTTRF